MTWIFEYVSVSDNVRAHAGRSLRSRDVSPPPAPISTDHKNYDPVYTRYDYSDSSQSFVLRRNSNERDENNYSILLISDNYMSKFMDSIFKLCKTTWVIVLNFECYYHFNDRRRLWRLIGGSALTPLPSHEKRSKQCRCENLCAYACFSRANAPSVLDRGPLTAPAPLPPGTISHFVMSAPMQWTWCLRVSCLCVSSVITRIVRPEWKRWPRQRSYRPGRRRPAVRPARWFCVCFWSIASFCAKSSTRRGVSDLFIRSSRLGVWDNTAVDPHHAVPVFEISLTFPPLLSLNTLPNKRIVPNCVLVCSDW